METPDNQSDQEVSFMPRILLAAIIGQLNEAREEICCFAGNHPDPDAERIMASIDQTLEAIDREVLTGPDPWPVLATAEMALADMETAIAKDYLPNAKTQIYTTMDRYRALTRAVTV